MSEPFVLTGDPRSLVMGEPYAGAEVDVRTDVPLGISLGIGRAMIRYGEAEAGSNEEAAALHDAWSLFGDDVLTGWNLYDHHGAVPAGTEAFTRVSPRFMVSLLGSWADLMTDAEHS